MSERIWIGTRKGVFSLRRKPRSTAWQLVGPVFLGHTIHHIVQDPRDPKCLLMAAKTGHLGPTVYRSTDWGRSWQESTKPPAFRKAAQGEEPRAVARVFWLTPGHASDPGVWYAGSSPAGLFRSEDDGDTWQPVSGFNDHPMRPQWAPNMGTPDGEFLHSIIVDPRNARHLYLAISIGGVFESTDGGRDWVPLNEGCAAEFLPDANAPFGHDPHCLVMHPRVPDRLYQQNHCGIYRIDRPAKRWIRIGNAMPKRVGDIGFPIVLHPTDPDVAWVFPMDGTKVWPRTAVEGRPAAYMTRNGGKSWRRLDHGLPKSQAWFTVLRQAMCRDAADPPQLIFGTTAGEVWAGAARGARWRRIAQHLPEIYCVNHAV
jgi:photosystem II stability/assembly factor-like uncharacterized protein